MTLASRVRDAVLWQARRLLGNSAGLQYLYGWLKLAIGQLEVKRHRDFHALECFCNVSARVAQDFSCRRRARSYLQQYFVTKNADKDETLRRDFLSSRHARSLRRRYTQEPFPRNLTFHEGMLPLKPFCPDTGEPGVLLMKYNFLFRTFYATYEMERLRENYWIVLEPSYHRFEDAGFALFRGGTTFIEARNPVLSRGLRTWGGEFHPVMLNSGDWVDPDVFRPLRDGEKKYDLILVGNWSRNKRHELLFATLAKRAARWRVALVGFPWERTRRDIERQMRRFGVASQCDVFEKLSAEEVNRLLNASRINLMLSEKELANKALYEAMFAGVPCLASAGCMGLDRDVINPQTGMLAEDDELGDAIEYMLAHLHHYKPREWATAKTGCWRATRTLNEVLRQVSSKMGVAWSHDIAVKVNRPNLDYKDPQDHVRFRPTLEHLATLLRPSR